MHSTVSGVVNVGVDYYISDKYCQQLWNCGSGGVVLHDVVDGVVDVAILVW